MHSRLAPCLLGGLLLSLPAHAAPAGADTPAPHGLAVEALGGALLLPSARGQLADVAPGFGARLSWALAPALGLEALRDMLWVDARWMAASLHDGTQQVDATTHLHHLTVAPAVALPLLPGGGLGAYLQVGAGFSALSSTVRVDRTETTHGGLTPLWQYGLGLRGQLPTWPSASVRLVWRVELTRLRRGSVDDTFAGVGVGAAL